MIDDHRTGAVMQSFLHGPLLVFHEAGHVIFRLFGGWMGSAGGTRAQLLMPAIACAALLRRHDAFGASLGLWLLGRAGWIGHAHALGGFVRLVGTPVVLLALAWGAAPLVVHKQALDDAALRLQRREQLEQRFLDLRDLLRAALGSLEAVADVDAAARHAA